MQSIRIHYRYSPFILAILVLGLGLSSCNKPGTTPLTANSAASEKINPPGAAAPMPPIATGHDSALNNQSFTLLDDRRMHLNQYLGNVVVLDFWATYCQPCV